LGNTIVKSVEKTDLQELRQKWFETNHQACTGVVVHIVIGIEKFITELEIDPSHEQHIERRKHGELGRGCTAFGLTILDPIGLAK
jgi:hypothetical protein